MHFEALAKEGEQALRARLSAYAGATRGGAGIFQSSEFVSGDEWHTVIEALRLREDYPAMLGLGWIEKGVVRYRMNLERKHERIDPLTGRLLNDFLRNPGPAERNVLTGELFAAFATLLPVGANVAAR